jgi:ferredoxin
VKIQKARLCYFSPTRTTKAILESIAGGTGVEAVEHLDVTLPDAERDFAEMKEDELLIIGCPVYAGRLPEIAVQRFNSLKSNGGPAVIVVLYGNREIEDALVELSDLAAASGFMPVAGGAFIGEHSFSSASFPLANGRPDGSDIQCAREFGKSIGEYLRSIGSLQDIGPLKLPGNRPYREHIVHPKTSPVTDSELCTACGTCASACPTGSILADKTAKTDVETCILCCACVKLCPENARALKDPFVGQIIEWLYSNTANRKEPEVFIAGH